MGKIVCKTCYDERYESWKKPFQSQISDPETIPDYNENMQHYSLYNVSDIGNTLQSGQMLEILCVYCKMTHVGKDENGILKVRYLGQTDWQTYNG